VFEEDASKLVFGGTCVAHRFSFVCGPIMCSYVLTSVLWCLLRFPHKHYVRFVFISSCLWECACRVYVVYVCLRI